MLALAKTKAVTDGLALCELEPRQPGPGEILVNVKAAGVCGTDMHIRNWVAWMAQRMKLPRVLGHEGSGVVVGIGEGVSSVKVGDKVSLESHIFCGKCYQCLMGRANVCQSTTYPGFDIDGTFAPYVTVPASIAWINPPDMPDEVAAVLEPFGIAVHATLIGSGVAGQMVLVNGCGPIGLMNVAVARYFGARTIVAADPNPLRRKMAEVMGSDAAVDPLEMDLPAYIRDVSGGNGADVVIEYSGQANGLNNCMNSVTAGGDLRLCAFPALPVEMDLNSWRRTRPSVYNIHGRKIWSTWVTATPLIYEKKIDLKPIISHIIPLSDGRRAFDLMLKGEALKPILIPGR
jgi:threonine 3-dehydrogenase